MLRFFFISLLLVSFNSLADFDWQGHRGARGIYPENTINGMKEALKHPITTLELDVVISKDLQVVVSHEPWMSAEICLDPKGKEIKDREINLFKMTYEEIKAFDCGSKIHPRFPGQKKVSESKPLLKDLIIALEKEMSSQGLKKNYNIEIKSTPEEEKDGFQPNYKEFSAIVVADILKLIPASRFSIQSFDWRVLQYLHEQYPQISLVALRETKYEPEKVLRELGFAPAVFSPDWKMLTKKQVTFFQKKKIKVIPWTVNTVADMKSLIEMGVDGIITDYPNFVAEFSSRPLTPQLDCGPRRNLFEGRCVKVPAHAHPSQNNPGWVCKDGHVQKRDSCVKVKLPAHAVWNEDGHTWTCKEGYVRYRLKCQKIK